MPVTKPYMIPTTKERIHPAMASIQPFQLDVADETLDDIHKRIAAFPWHEMPDDGGWAYGANLGYMQELCDYWRHEFDWRKQEARINHFSHYISPVDGIDIHFIREKGSGPKPMPLILSHGWPGSVTEFLNIIEPLAIRSALAATSKTRSTLWPPRCQVLGSPAGRLVPMGRAR